MVGLSKADLALAEAHLSAPATSLSGQTELAEPGLAVWPAGYRLLLRWCTKETQDNKAPQPLVMVPASGAAGVLWLCSLDKPEVVEGLSPKRTKADATRWVCGVAWQHVKEMMQPTPRKRPHMSIKWGPGAKWTKFSFGRLWCPWSVGCLWRPWTLEGGTFGNQMLAGGLLWGGEGVVGTLGPAESLPGVKPLRQREANHRLR